MIVGVGVSMASRTLCVVIPSYAFIVAGPQQGSHPSSQSISEVHQQPSPFVDVSVFMGRLGKVWVVCWVLVGGFFLHKNVHPPPW